MRIAPAQFWVESKTADGMPNMQLAFESIEDSKSLTLNS